MEVDEPARKLLEQPLIGNLGFQGLDGYPRVIPVWFEFTGEEILVASPPGAYKSRALEAAPRAALTVSTAAPPYEVASAVGDAVVTTVDERERIEVVAAMANRYLGTEGGRKYVEGWIRGGHPGPGDVIRLRSLRIRYSLV